MTWALFNKDQQVALAELLEADKSDRVVAIVGGSILDNSLEIALRLRLRPAAGKETDIAAKVFRVTGPLGSLAPKVDLGYLLYMYDKPIRNAMYGLSEVRNFFAHRLAADMNSKQKKFTEGMAKLTLHTSESHYLNPIALERSKYEIEKPNGPRDVFIINLKICLIWLLADSYRHTPYHNVLL
jgi:hypothetical protein